MQQVHLDNLAKLRDFLITHPVPFKMSVYRDGSISPEIIQKGVNECGTPACALGWLPFAIELDEEDWEDGSLDYAKLAIRHLGVDSDNRWNWMFGHSWYAIDDTRLGAAYRIDFLLNKDVPDTFHTAFQMQRNDVEDYLKGRDEWIAKYHAIEAD